MDLKAAAMSELVGLVLEMWKVATGRLSFSMTGQSGITGFHGHNWIVPAYWARGSVVLKGMTVR